MIKKKEYIFYIKKRDWKILKITNTLKQEKQNISYNKEKGNKIEIEKMKEKDSSYISRSERC